MGFYKFYTTFSNYNLANLKFDNKSNKNLNQNKPNSLDKEFNSFLK